MRPVKPKTQNAIVKELRLSDWLRWALRRNASFRLMTLWIVLAASIAGTTAVYWSSPTVIAARQHLVAVSEKTLVLSGFALKSVQVSGRERTDAVDLRNALAVARGMPIFAIDTQALRAKLEEIPWIETASVARSLPDTVQITIVERKPFALWQHDKKLHLIDRTGKPITEQGLEAWNHLPLVVGEGANLHAAQGVDMLATQPSLMPRVQALVRVGDRRWNVRLDNGVDVRLPEEKPEEAWGRLAALEDQHKLLARAISVVDMRLEDRLVVRVIGELPKRVKTPGQDT